MRIGPSGNAFTSVKSEQPNPFVTKMIEQNQTGLQNGSIQHNQLKHPFRDWKGAWKNLDFSDMDDHNNESNIAMTFLGKISDVYDL